MTDKVTITEVIAHLWVITFSTGGSLMRFCYFQEEFHRWLILSKLFWFMLVQVYNDILTFVLFSWGWGNYCLLNPIIPYKHLCHNNHPTHGDFCFVHRPFQREGRREGGRVGGKEEEKQTRQRGVIKSNANTVTVPLFSCLSNNSLSLR